VYGEIEALERFFGMLRTDQDRAYYGFKHCKFAAGCKAVDTLMISDNLLRGSDTKIRTQYVDMVNDVREGGGKVHVVSSLHVTGEQLQKMTGVAAILRFPLPEVDVEGQEDVHSESSESSGDESD
jgi:protein pelota